MTSRRPNFAVAGTDAAGESIRLEFGILTRSIARDSTTFEVDRFYKYRDRLVSRPYLLPVISLVFHCVLGFRCVSQSLLSDLFPSPSFRLPPV